MSWDRERGQGRKNGTSSSHMSLLPTSEAMSFLETLFSLFLGKFLWLVFVVNIHCVGIPRESTSGGSGGMEGERSVRGILLSNSSSKVFLA